MKPIRALRLIPVILVLILVSLACAQSSSPTPTAPPVPPTEKPQVLEPTQIPTSPPAPTPEPSPIPQPEVGELIFEEKYADNSNNWYVSKDADTETLIEDGKFKVRVLVQDKFFSFDAPRSIANVDVSVDTEFTEGAPENTAYGLLCHYQDADNTYRFRIAPDGVYSIDKWVGGADVVSLVTWTASSAIKTGMGVVNTVRAVCGESHLTLYVNDTLLADVTDTSLSGGSFALFTAAYANNEQDKNPVGVNFSNLVVRKPLAWTPPTDSLLTDTFDDNRNDWDIYEEDLASAQIVDGTMVIKDKEPESTYYVYPGLSLSNVDMVFDVVIQEGTPANTGFGAACRHLDMDNLYLFDIAGDGYYALNKEVNGVSEKVADWLTSSAIKTGVGIPTACV